MDKLKVFDIEANEERFKRFFYESGDAYIILKGGVFTGCNKKACEILKMDESNLIGSLPSDISPKLQPDGRTSKEKAMEMIEKAKLKGSHRFEWQHKKRDGEVFWADIVLTSIDLKGEEDTYFVMIRDITKQKKLENNMKRVSERLEIATKSGKIGVWEWDIERDELIWDDEMYSIYGISKSENKLPFEVWANGVHPEDIKKAEKELSEAVKNRTHFDTEFKVVEPNGKVKYVYASAQMKLNEKNEPKSMIGINMDITDREKALKELRESELFLSQATQNARIGLWDWNIKTGETNFNEVWASICGYKLEELKPVSIETWVKLSHPDDLENSNKQLQLCFERKKESYECEARMKHKDGHWIWVLDRGKVVKWADDGTPVRMIGTHIEITELKRITEELIKTTEHAKEMAKKAKKASKAKSQFLANMSHEIRTPMNGMIGFLKLLENTKLNEEQMEMLRDAKSASYTLLNLINDLMDFSKIEAGKIELESIEFDLREIVEDAVSIILPQAEVKSLNVYLIMDSNLPSSVKGDPSRIKQILVNLLTNAVKFTEKGEINIKVYSNENLNNNLNNIQFEIEDTGIGIKKEVVNKLFKPFTQADASTTRKFGGTGLGLAICKELVQMMKGRIDVESEYGRGSKFKFEINLKSGVMNTEKENTLKEIFEKRVLVVDSCDKNRLVFKEYIKEFTSNVFEAESIDKALTEMITANMYGEPFDIMIVNNKLDDLSGVEIADMVKKIPTIKNVKVVLSGLTTTHLEENKNIIGYLTKPLKRRDLIKVFERSIETTENKLKENEETYKEVYKDKVKNAKILLVEDNEMNQRLFEAFIRKEGLKSEIAENGKIAFEKAREKDYDIVFMDCQMPILDGYSATRLIREYEGDKKHTPIVAMTAYAMKGQKEKCIEAGMDDYISKPIDFDIVKEKIKFYVNLKYKNKEENLMEEAMNKLISESQLNEEDVKEIYDGFIEKLELEIKKFLEHIENKRYGEVSKQAHKLKGASGNLRIHWLEEKMLELEIYAKDKDEEKCIQSIEDVKSKFL